MKLIDFNPNAYPSQPDPFILKGENGKFYVYSTSVDGVRAYESDSLTGEYKDLGFVFTMEGKKEYWAPSVIYTHGKYYMYVSCMPKDSDDCHMEAMHVASSTSPRGPFVDAKQLIEPFSIDSHVVENESGLFIFYSINDYDDPNRAGTYIVVDKMPTPESVEGKPVTVLKPTLDEEIFQRDRFKKGQHWHTLEGAFYFREGDYHYIIYSGNCYQNEYYYLGYAVAKTTETDLTKIKFTKYPNENTYMPLIAKNEFEEGTGHNSVIKEDGVWYAVYHGRDAIPDVNLANLEEKRTARICKLVLDGEKMVAERYEDKL